MRTSIPRAADGAPTTTLVRLASPIDRVHWGDWTSNAARHEAFLEVVRPLAATPLEERGSLLVRVLRRDEDRIELSVQRWSDAKLRWESIPYIQTSGVENRFGALEPGRFRAIEKVTGLVSDPVDVEAGVCSEIELDLQQRATIVGRVEAPVDEDVHLARVYVEEEGAELGDPGLPGVEVTREYSRTALPGVAVDADGGFRIDVTTRRQVRLSVWHPWLKTARRGGEADVGDPSEFVFLALGCGATVTFTPRYANDDQHSLELGVFFVDGAGGARAPATLAIECGGVAHFAAPASAPGAFTLLLDPGGDWAPVVRKDLTLTGRAQDLGAIAFGHGSALCVKPSMQAGTVHAFEVRATSVDAPVYSRSAFSNSRNGTVLAGLGAGNFKVKVAEAHDSSRVLFDGAVAVDGVHDFELPVGSE